MKIIEIAPRSNGAHRNQTGTFRTIPEGWAVIPDGMAIPDTFPFVDVTAENGIITSIAAGQVPEPEPRPEPEPTPQDDTDSMLIDHEYRLTLLELGIAE